MNWLSDLVSKVVNFGTVLSWIILLIKYIIRVTKGEASMPHWMTTRAFNLSILGLVLCLLGASIYNNFINPIETINDPRITLRRADPERDYITIDFNEDEPTCRNWNYANMLHCFVISKTDKSFNVLWIFQYPLDYSTVILKRKDGTILDTAHYRLGKTHDRNLIEFNVDTEITRKEIEISAHAVKNVTKN